MKTKPTVDGARSAQTSRPAPGGMDLPEVIFPVVRVPQPDGSVLFRPGKAVIASEEIGSTEAGRLLGMSRRWVEGECASGGFKTARKLGGRPKSRWRISRTEVMARRESAPE